MAHYLVVYQLHSPSPYYVNCNVPIISFPVFQACMLFFQPATTHRPGTSAANSHHVLTEGKQSKLPETAGKDIDVCEDIRHCGAAQIRNFTCPARSSPLKRKFDPQVHFNLQVLRFYKLLANCIMNTSSSGFVSSLASLVFIFQTQEDTQSFSHKISWKVLHLYFFFPLVNHAIHNQLLFICIPKGIICNIILFL